MPQFRRALPLAALLLVTAGAAQAQSGTGTRFSGVPRIGSDSGWSIKPRGRVQYDIGGVSVPDGVNAPGIGSLNELRRAQLGVEGTAPGGIDYLFEVEFAEGIAEITEATVSMDVSSALTVTVGQHNNFQSLEELTSDRFGSFMERAAFTDAFNFERALGVSGRLKLGDFTAQLGVFGDNLLDIDDGVPGRSVDGRVFYAPDLNGTRLHLGASAHWRDNGDIAANGSTTRYRQRPQIHATDIRFVSTAVLPVENERRFGLEAAVIHGPFHATGEAQWLRTDLPGAQPNRSYFGGYAEVGWFLTGESRGYRDGRWDRTRVRRGKAIEEGGLGAVQVNLRYDRLDLEEGGRQDGVMASLIWIPTDYVRFTLNYARLSFDNARLPAAGGDRDYSVDVWGLRAAVDF